MSPLFQSTVLKLGRLQDILADITDAIENPDTVRTTAHRGSPHIYDNMEFHDDVSHQKTNLALSALLPSYKDATLSHSNDLTPYSSPRDYPATVDRLQPGSAFREYHCTDAYVSFTTLDSPAVAHLSPSQTLLSGKPDEKQVNRHWNKMVSAAAMVTGDRVDLISFVDDHDEPQNSSVDSTDQTSISQLSTVASSGYQSFGYSQSSSPVEPLGGQTETPPQTDASGAPTAPQQPLSFANPLFGQNGSVAGSGATNGLMLRSVVGEIYHSPSSSSLSDCDDIRSRSLPRDAVPSSRRPNPAAYSSQSQTLKASRPQRKGTPPLSGSRTLEIRRRKAIELSASSSSTESLPVTDRTEHLTRYKKPAHRFRNAGDNPRRYPLPNASSSPQLSRSTHRVESPVTETRYTTTMTVTPSEFSRSMDSPKSHVVTVKAHVPPQGMRRNMTDTGVHYGMGSVEFSSTPPESPRGVKVGAGPPPRRPPPPHSTNLRMGVSGLHQQRQQQTASPVNPQQPAVELKSKEQVRTAGVRHRSA